MTQSNNVQMNEKLDRMLRLLAVVAVKGLSQTDQIAVLNRIGFPPKEIAEIVGTTANTVRVTLVGIRRAAAHGKRRGLLEGAQEEMDA